MSLIKTSFWTGFSTLIKAFFSYFLWKIIAVYTGPAGLATIEQFQNFIQICRSFSSCLNQGVIKYVSEYKEDEENRSKILSNAFVIYATVSIFMSLLLCLFSTQISEKIFSSIDYRYNIILLGVSISIYSINCLLLSVLNAELEIKKYASCNIFNTVLFFILTVYLLINYGIQGGLIGFILNQCLSLIFTIYLVTKNKWFKLIEYFQGIDWNSINKILKFASISFVPIIITPLASFILRKYIAFELSWDEAGYWQGITKLSDGYISLMELMVGVYFLPKLSNIRISSQFKNEIFRSYGLIIPIVLFGTLAIFILKKQIVKTLYSEQFLPMLVLFKFQLIGDIARIGTWLLAIIMAAKAQIRILVTAEITFNFSYVLLTMLCVHYFGLIGTSIGFAINSIIYFLWMTLCTSQCIRSGSFKLVMDAA